MMKSLIALACATLMTCGLQAQIGGSLNRGAPKVSTTLEMGGNKLSVNYTSIRFGEGSWQKIKDNADRHERFNKFAESTPLGNVKTSCDLMAAGKKIPAGDYSMFFSVHEQAGWILNLKPAKGDAIRWGLKLNDAAKKTGCMKISLEPSAKNGMCSISIAFGGKQVTVPVSAAPAKDGDK